MSNKRTELLMSTYKPELSIMVYKSADNYYLESHDINSNGQLMEGKPLLQETLQNIVDVFFDERKNMVQVAGIIPMNVLQFALLPGGNYRMIWYNPAEERVMHFAPQLKLKTGKTWVPPMIYLAERNSLYVFALKSNTRPLENTKLCRAPFHNVADDGLVCLGNAAVKKPSEKTYKSFITYWEDLFWLSEFTHLNGSSKTVRTDMHTVWKKLLASKTKLKWSDMNELLPYKSKTLKNILK